MKSEDYVRAAIPRVELHMHHGSFVGGNIRYEIKVGKKIIGMSTLRRSAWAEAMRYIKEHGTKGLL